MKPFSFFIRHPFVTLFVIVPIIAIAITNVPPMYRNYKGVCSEVGRVLTDAELIERAIRDEVNATPKEQPMEKTLWLDGREQQVFIFYETTYEEFIKNNPDCCKLQDVNHLTPLSEKVSGQSHRYIQFRRLLRYRDQNGKEGSFQTDFGEAFILTNCGKSHY